MVDCKFTFTVRMLFVLPEADVEGFLFAYLGKLRFYFCLMKKKYKKRMRKKKRKK